MFPTFAFAFALITCLLAGPVACAQQPLVAPPPTATAASPAATPQLLFFSGRITTTTAAMQTSLLEVMQLQTVPGELKQAPADAIGTNLLRLTQLDADGHPLASRLLPHPLRPRTERAGVSYRTYGGVQGQAATATFFVQLALQPRAVILRVEEILDQRPTILSNIPLASVMP